MEIFWNIISTKISKKKNLFWIDIEIDIHIVSHWCTYVQYKYIQIYVKKVQSKILQTARNHRYILNEIFFFQKICFLLTMVHVKRTFMAVNIHPCNTLLNTYQKNNCVCKNKCKRVDRLAYYLITRINTSSQHPYHTS